MLDPISASSLAGSIVTFCDFTYKVGKRVYELSQLQGELPPDIQKCKEIAEILERATKHFSTQLPSSSAGQPTVGPITLFEADLLQLFNQCTNITKSFLDLLEELADAKSLSKALKVVRKEGKLHRIHDDLDRRLIEIMYLLNGQTSTQTKEVMAIVTIIREEMLQHHAKLEAKMRDSITQLSGAIGKTKEEAMSTVTRLSTNEERALNIRQMEIVSGQQDLSQNLGRAFQNIRDTLEARESGLASKMETMLREQSTATNMLYSSCGAQDSTATAVQLERLDEILLKTLEDVRKHRLLSGVRPEEHQQHQPVKTTEQNGLVLRAEFEFSFRNDIIAIHVKQCAQLISTKLSAKFEFRWPSLITQPCPPTWFLERFNRTNQGPRNHPEEPVMIILETVISENLVAQINTGEQELAIRDAIDQAFCQWRGPFLSWLSFTTISSISYVKYERNGDKGTYFLPDHRSALSGDPIQTGHFWIDAHSTPSTSTRAPRSGPANKEVSQGYVIVLEEKFAVSRPFIIIGVVEVIKILLTYHYSLTSPMHIILTSCFCLTCHVSVFICLDVVVQFGRSLDLRYTVNTMFNILVCLAFWPQTSQRNGVSVAFLTMASYVVPPIVFPFEALRVSGSFTDLLHYLRLLGLFIFLDINITWYIVG